jgi:hypothetical protein
VPTKLLYQPFPRTNGFSARDGAAARRGRGAGAHAHAVSQPIQLTREESSPSQILESIESRVGDRGFWLQTGYNVVLSYGEADKGVTRSVSM